MSAIALGGWAVNNRKPADTTTLSLPTAADLSIPSYETAKEQMFSWAVDNGICNYFHLYRLTVGYWTSDEALQVMAKHKDCEVLVVKDMPVDAWRLAHTYFPVELYCEGA